MPQTQPRFEARPDKRVGWCIVVTWPSRKTEIINGFETQYAALHWIRTSAQNWLVDRILKSPE